MLHLLKYRAWFKGITPRPIRLEVPGWAGEKHYETGQPWHCKPFVDAATYGLEIVYPFDTEVRVTCQDGKCDFSYNSDEEWKLIKQPNPFPFSNFTPNHFGFTSSIDIKTPPGYSTLIMPHPRFFTDMTGSVPLPSCGMLESDWWPKIFFIAFRAPLAGHEYVFRKGEGIAQLMFVPTYVQYNVEQMSQAEANEREETEKLLNTFIKFVATKKWTDNKGQLFQNSYKTLSLIAKKDGPTGVLAYLKQVAAQVTGHRNKSRPKLRHKVVTLPRKDADTHQ